MKKISVIVLLLLALTLVFAACNKTPATARVARWENNEHYEFNISLANFNIKEGDFAREYSVQGEKSFDKMEFVVPHDVRGRFVMDIVVNDNNVCTFTTTQTLYEQYPAKDVPVDKLHSVIIANDSAENPFTENEGYTTLKSVRYTEVSFTNDAAQRPYASMQKINGYFIGKTHQEVTNTEVKTTYSFSSKKATMKVSVDGKSETKNEIKLKKLKNNSIIDANQVLLYIRSLEKSESSFQDTPAVSIFDAFTNTVMSASFTNSRSCKTILHYGNESPLVTINSTACVVDGSVFMVQMNVPDSVNSDNKNLDLIGDATSKYSKYTTMRFRVNYLSYELADYDSISCADNFTGAQIIEAVTAK